VNIISGKRQPAEAERADGVSLSRRKVLGGLAALPAIPVLYSVGSVSPALASMVTRPGSLPEATDELVRGVERRYNAPLLTPGTRLVLPADIKALPIQDYYRYAQLASAETAWALADRNRRNYGRRVDRPRTRRSHPYRDPERVHRRLV